MAKRSQTKYEPKAPKTDEALNPIVEKTLEAVEEAIENVETEINIPETEKEVETDLGEVNDIIEKIEEVETAKATLDEKLANNPDNAEEILKEELKKAQAIKKDALKVLRKINNEAFTTSWNGINYDF